VKLLFDQNLSRFLVERVGSEFKGSLHVIQLGLDQATDRKIWDWAGEHDFTIVSKDSDFHDLAAPPLGSTTEGDLAASRKPIDKSDRTFVR
jgi:predicted nuclease of predicted toxin-antitoxin system